MLSDEKLQQLFTLERGPTKLAQRSSMSSSRQKLAAKKIITQDLTADGPAVADGLSKSAAMLHAQIEKALQEAQGLLEFGGAIQNGPV